MAGRTLAAAAQPAKVKPRELEARKPDGKRIRELDGLRALAILMVLVAHAFSDPQAVEAVRALPEGRWASVLLSHLWLGVDLFFALSGFLITGILLDSRNERRYYQNFYIRRALRILPVLFAALAFIAVVFHGPPAYFALALLFCANFASSLNIRAPQGAGPLWSLSVEEQFYLLWPTFVRRLAPNALLWVAGGVVALVPTLRAMMEDPTTVLSFTWMRCDGLAVGAFAAVWIRCRPTTPRSLNVAIAGTAALSIAILIFETVLGSPRLSHALRPTEADLLFGAAILAAYAWQGSPGFALLRSPAAVFVAATSYCAYVIHLSVYTLIDSWGWTASHSPLHASLLRMLIGLPLIFGVAALSKRFLEDPFLRLKATLAPHERSERLLSAHGPE